MSVIWKGLKETVILVKTYRPLLFLILFIQLLCGVAYPFLLSAFASFVLYVVAVEKDILMAFLYIGGYAGMIALLSTLSTYIYEVHDPMMYSVRQQIILKLYAKTMNIDYAMLEDMEYREALNRAQQNGIANDAVGFEAFVRHMMKLASASLSVLLYAAMFASVEWWLALLVVLLSLCGIFFMQKAQAYEHLHKADYAKDDQQLQYYHHEVKLPKNGKDIRLFHMQDWLLKKIRVFQKNRLDWTNNIEKKYLIARYQDTICSFLRNILIYGYFVYRLFHGMDIASFIFYVSAASALSTWIVNIVTYVNEVKRAALGISDYDAYMDFKDDKPISSKTFSFKHCTITFDHVSFAYPGAEKDTIHDVSFTIHANENIGLVGSNGAGKTTLVKLLCGLYEPTQGTIYLNDTNMKELSKEAIFQHTAAIFQDSINMAYSLEKNITCMPEGKGDIDLMWECLDNVGLKSKVMQFAKQEKTFLSNIIAEDGVLLSGGEQQKVLMARALYKKADILLLDEPSAALDAIAEAALYENYQRVSKDAVSIFISHRLASTRFCDRIFLFENGSILESGNHEELLAQKGLYAKMYETQASYYQEQRGKEE